MKKSLLATVAAVALFAGTGLAAAEGATGQQAPKAGASEMNKGAGGGADAKGGAEQRGGAATTGSGAGAEQKAGDKAQNKGSAAGKADKGADNKAMNGNRSTTGSGAAESGRTEQRPSQGQAQGQGTRSQTTGQGASEPRSSQSEPRMRNERQGQPGAAQERTQRGQTQPGTAQERSQSNTTVQGQASGQAGASVNLTQEQKTKIRTTVIESRNAPKISRSQVSFNVSVGTVVPRTVKFVAVPPTLVEIHPQWRGYRYFIVEEEIVIVDPNTFRIVAVLTV